VVSNHKLEVRQLALPPITTGIIIVIIGVMIMVIIIIISSSSSIVIAWLQRKAIVDLVRQLYRPNASLSRLPVLHSWPITTTVDRSQPFRQMPGTGTGVVCAHITSGDLPLLQVAARHDLTYLG
jgi:hypothetical protein